MTAFPPPLLARPINVVALGVAVSAALIVVYVLCWLVAVILPDAPLSHGWINLFTTAPVSSVRALIEGVIWNIVLAWVISIVLTPIYNKMAGD
jgi:hypothetical protein